MLRTRLMSGLACLLIILLSMGLYSINQCSDLGKRIEAIGRDNDQAGRNLQQMKRNATAMTAALLSVVTGDQNQSKKDFDTASANFQSALDEENARKSASAEEKGLIAKLTESFHSYLSEAQIFLALPERTERPGRSPGSKLGQDISKIFDLGDQLTVAHEHALSVGNTNSADDINHTIKFLILLMIIAIAAFLAAYFGLSRGLLSPLKSLTTSIRQVGAGDLDQEISVSSRDELGILATSFNKMASQLREYRANASDELIRLNTTIRATLASFPDPIFVLNSQGEVEFRNPEADQLAVKLLFAGVTRLPQKVDEKVEHVRATGEDYLPTLFQEALKFHVSGQDRYFLPRIVLLRNEAREVFGVAVILEDVTRMLLLDDIKSGLISTVSHELKTPLTSVRMALYLLHEKTVGSLNEKQADLVLTAREDADRLLKTLNDLLDLAKLEQGPTPLDLKPVAAADLVNTAERENREIAHTAQITLVTEIAPGLPEVRVDRQRVAYVFANLITNAVKYSPKGSKIVVQAGLGNTRDEKPSVRFSVKDQGFGITPEHLEHVFDRFYRVPGTNKTGAGLGLSIAREIVTAHQGEIGVISQPGQGSDFFFLLPITPARSKA